MRFEWDSAKNTQNIAKHGIDFVDAVLVFGAVKLYTYRSDRRDGETLVRRIISVRRAQQHERKAYDAA